MALVSRSEFAIFGLWEGCHVNYVDLLLKAVAREIGYGLNHVAGRSQSGFDPVCRPVRGTGFGRSKMGTGVRATKNRPGGE
jgi:hypothetical protein